MNNTQPFSRDRNALLSIRNLTVNYAAADGKSVHAVDRVSLDIAKGEVVALVGESGSGKSSVALAIPRLLPPSAKEVSGSIIFDGNDTLRMSKEELRAIRGKHIAMVFQDPISFLNPLLRVGDQIAETLMIHERLTRSQASDKTKQLLEKVRVPDADRIYKAHPHQLSGGIGQRVVIATAIACNPSLLIADEPTSNLDVTVQAQVLHLLYDLSQEFRMTTLLISHDLGVVSGMADRVVVMYAGRIAEEAPVKTIYERAYHPYTKLLLQSSGLSGSNGTEKVRGSLPDLTNPPPGCRFAPRCPFAMTTCTQDPPILTPEPYSNVSCWLYKQ